MVRFVHVAVDDKSVFACKMKLEPVSGQKTVFTPLDKAMRKTGWLVWAGTGCSPKAQKSRTANTRPMTDGFFMTLTNGVMPSQPVTSKTNRRKRP